ncbi:C2 domain [Pseudocohnilembus persalinus]|uniref:C2 domain n=1 Tax=Pseudocohnilembus persalinus TaxID=266149 RepID=A0A0V0QEY7_PSEPJ|nr:C2 domain [Pseudocohnilembus persalinus]|eukprot:KRX00777.1 C2 domain [Pseudocohnilembus persalinus]
MSVQKKQEEDKFLLYETEVFKSTLQVDFQKITFNYGKLCLADKNQPIKIEVWDYKKEHKQDKLGEIVFSINDIELDNMTKFDIVDQNFSKKGEMVLKDFNRVKKKNFLNYIESGTNIFLNIGIDFSSQKYSNRASSFKHNDQHSYREALKKITSVLLPYDSDQSVPMYGISGKTAQSGEYQTFFQLNEQNLEATGYENIIKFYDESLKNVKLGETLQIAPIIEKLNEISKQHLQDGVNGYHVLLILTDGAIDDMQETKKQIIQSSGLPLSIIIVGLKNYNYCSEEEYDNNYQYMKILDGDQGLFDSDGNKASRDLVKFVDYQKYRYNTKILTSQILDQLPQQLCQYMEALNEVTDLSTKTTINKTSMNQSLIDGSEQNTIGENQTINPLIENDTRFKRKKNYKLDKQNYNIKNYEL